MSLDHAGTGDGLDIDFKRSCDCASNHLNCLTAREWMKAQIGVWQFYYESGTSATRRCTPRPSP